jgi:hypothetical protein
VTVEDTEPPGIGHLRATPAVLWPPNHKMREVAIEYDVADNCPGVTCALSVASGEPAKCDDDADDEAPDWAIVDAKHVWLRAERSGQGKGRTYTITATCTDGAGNTATGSTAVVVPHDQHGGDRDDRR